MFAYTFTIFTVGRGLAPAETYGKLLQRREQAPALRCEFYKQTKKSPANNFGGG